MKEEQAACKTPLQGVRVVDFTWALAGPYGTMLLAMLGAEVIKVESSTRMDLSRRMYMAPGAKLGEFNKASSFSDFNLNKKSITLNLREPRGIGVIKELVAISDLVIDNYSPGVMDRLGLNYDVLRGIRPDIIMVSESAMGATGPEAEYVGFAPTFNSLSGLGHVTGYPDCPPTEIRTGIDLRVGSTVAFAALMALNYRAVTGRGQYVDVSARESIACLAADKLLEFTITGRSPTRQGNRDGIMAPHNCYRCKGDDRWLSIAVGDDEEWAALCKVMGNPTWTRDPRFGDQYNRWANQQELDKLVESWTLNGDSSDLTEKLQAAGVAAFPSLSSEDLFTDRHSQERDLYDLVEHAEIGARLVLRPPFRLSQTPAKNTTGGPLLGEHNRNVMCGLLGKPEKEVENLAAEGVMV